MIGSCTKADSCPYSHEVEQQQPGQYGNMDGDVLQSYNQGVGSRRGMGLAGRVLLSVGEERAGDL